MRRPFLWVSLFSIACATVVAQEVDRATYKSPYSINPSVPTKDLMGDLLAGKRADPKEQSTVEFRDWYKGAGDTGDHRRGITPRLRVSAAAPRSGNAGA